MLRASCWFLAVLQLVVLLPANVYFGIQGHVFNSVCIGINLVFGVLALSMALDEGY